MKVVEFPRLCFKCHMLFFVSKGSEMFRWSSFLFYFNISPWDSSYAPRSRTTYFVPDTDSTYYSLVEHNQQNRGVKIMQRMIMLCKPFINHNTMVSFIARDQRQSLGDLTLSDS